MNPNLKRTLRKVLATVLVVSDLHTQVAMAGMPVWLGLPPGVAPLASQTSTFAKKAMSTSVIWFNAFPYSNLLDPRGQTDLPQQGQSTPENVVDREERQMDILRQMEELQIFQEETFANRPELPGSSANILDSVSTYKLNVNVAKELRKVQEDLKRTAGEQDQEMQSMRKAVNGAGGSVRIGDDGSRQYTLHGLVVAIRGQRSVDGNGQITTTDTRRIKYDPKTRLQTSSTRISKDSRGNATVTVRENLKYSADSNQKGKQIIEEYKETILDPNGNLSTVHRKNIKYLAGPDIKKIKGEDKRGQYVLSYDEEKVDMFGNRSTTVFSDAQYQRFNDDWYMTGYKQIDTDADKNVTVTERKQTSFVFNPNYRKLKTIRTSRQEYLSSGYLQVVTDPKGQVKTEIWSGMTYDNRDNLIAYNQILQGSDPSLNTEVVFRNGQYDQYGQQTGFDRLEKYADGSKVRTRRLSASYNKIGDVTGYDEIVEADGGYLVHTIRSGITYNRKRQQIEYRDLKVDQAGRFINVTWQAWQNGFRQDAAVDPSATGWNSAEYNLGYDRRGRLVGTKETTEVGGETVVKFTTDMGYDARGGQAGKFETTIAEDDNGNTVIHYVHTERLATTYDPLVANQSGLVTAYSDRVTDWAVEEDSGIILRDLLTLIDRTNISLDGYNETKTITGGVKRQEASQDTSETMENIVTTVQSGTVYDGSGRINRYNQQTIDETYTGTGPGRTLQTRTDTDSVFSNLVYDPQNRQLSSKEDATVTKPLLPGTNSYRVITDRGAMTYDAFDRLSTVTTKTHTITSGTDTTSTATRTGIEYNVLGDISKYSEAVVSSASPNLTETTAWEGKRYSVLGRLKKTVQDLHRLGSDPDGSALDTHRLTVTEDMEYDDKNRLTDYTEYVFEEGANGGVPYSQILTGYDAIIAGSISGLYTKNEVAGITYDARDHQTMGSQTSSRIGAGVNEVTVTTKDNLTFDGNGILTGYREIVTSPDTVTTTNLHSSIVWTDWGQNDQVASRTTTTSSSDATAMTTTTDYTAQFDSLGRTTITTEDVFKSGATTLVQGGTLNSHVLKTTETGTTRSV